MKILKPPRLRKGDLIGIAAPASPVASTARLHKGIRYLERLGYNVLLAKHVHDRRGYLAGRDRDRAADLNALFSDRRVKAIFMARGGYGSHRILPLLDYKSIQHHPKILVGYSDITALSAALFAKSGLVSFAGPMVATEFADGAEGTSEELFWRLLTSPHPLGKLANPGNHPLQSLGRGAATGRLVGGNLSILTSLTGTTYLPSFKGGVLFLEDEGEDPYRIDRMVHHLSLAGIFRKLNGLILGSFANCLPSDKKKPTLTLQQIFEDVVRQAPLPTLQGLHHGHVHRSLTLPVGIRVSISTVRRTIELTERAVS